MGMTVREMLNESVLTQANPQVIAGKRGLGNTVRWAYTNERRDVASFLAGGELLIIEGRNVFGALSAQYQQQYIESLVNKGVAGLVIELVEDTNVLAEVVCRYADEQGFPLIGLYTRIPFVDACQSMNTLIIRKQMLIQMESDTLSTVLRRQLANVRSASDVSEQLAEVFGEHVAIFNPQGVQLAAAGPASHDTSAVIGVQRDGVTVASLEISQRVRVFDEDTKQVIARICSQVLPMVIMHDIGATMMARIIQGPAHSVHASREEVYDATRMLQALGWEGGTVWYPFVIGMRSLEQCMGEIDAMIAELEFHEGVKVYIQVQGRVLFGIIGATSRMLAEDGSNDIQEEGTDRAALAQQCIEALRAVVQTPVGQEGLRVCGGRATSDVAALIDTFGVLREVVQTGEHQWGTCLTICDALMERFTTSTYTQDAIAMFTEVLLGRTVLSDEVLLHTLRACFDTGDHRSKACKLLGVSRQTLYNRLDKVKNYTGIGPDSGKSWSMLLFAAKVAPKPQW